MNTNNKQNKLLQLQIYASIFFIITIFVSIILTYNNLQKQRNQKPIFTNLTENQINFLNRIVITILAIIFTYINYSFYQISKQKNNETIQKDEFIASIFTLIAGFILLSTTIQTVKNNIQNTDTETPII